MRNIHRLIPGGVIFLFTIAVAISAVTGQPAGEDRPRSAGLPGALAHAATDPDPPRDLTVIASIVTTQENATSTPPTMGDTEGSEGQGAAQEAPSTPGRPSVSGITHSAITLSWGAVSGATHYDAKYEDRDGNSQGSQINGITGTSYTFSGLSPSTRYVFNVRAGNAVGDSGWSLKRYGTTTARPTPLSLPDPSDRTLTKDVSTSFTLPLAKGGNAPYKHSASGLPAGLSFTASSRKVSGTPTALGTSTVTYRVTDSVSGSDEQTFTITVINEPIPSAPGRPSASGITHNSVSLSWGSVTGATHYDARYRDRDAGGSDIPGSWSQADGISGTSKTFSGLTASTRYEFEVRAGNDAGDSNWSPSRYATTTAPPPDTPTPTPTPTPTSVPTPTGTLSASPTTIFIGETTTLTSSNVTPSNTQVKLVYDTKLTHRDSCPEVRAASNHNTVTLSSPNSSVTFIGCWQGTADVTLRTVDGNVELDDVDITINTPSVDISDLMSSLGKGEQNEFSVSVSNISSEVSYRIEALAGDSDLSFTDDCEVPDTTKQSGDLSGDAEHKASTKFTLYACKLGGATVFASLLHGNRTIGLDSQYVAVTTPTPTPTPTTTPPTAPPAKPPAKVVSLNGMPGSTRGEILLDWAPATGATSYQVAEWRRRIGFIPILYHWVILNDSGDNPEVTITLQTTSAVVHGLEGGKTYEHRVRGVNSNGNGEWSDPEETTLTLPDKVTGLTGAPGPNHGEITLTWDAADEATAYQGQQQEFGETTWVIPANGVNIVFTDTSAVVRNLEPDETYVFQVRGTNVHGEGEWSDTSAEITVEDQRPDQPQSLTTALLRGNRGIVLRWARVAGAAGYEVEVDPVEALQRVDVAVFPETWAEITGLTPGTSYDLKVRAWNMPGTSRLYSPWSETNVDGPAPSFWEGHQEDHTVAYQVGALPNPLPATPTHFDDPSTVVTAAAIDTAAASWNGRVAGLQTCRSGTCGSDNHDLSTITVKTEDNDTDDTDDPNHDPNDGCGWSIACVKLGDPSTSEASANGPGNHLRDLWLVIEEPAWECRRFDRTGACVAGQHVRIYWTDNSRRDNSPVTGLPAGSPPSFFYRINPLLIHEFGHTFGLPHFGGASIMTDFHIYSTITPEDEAQLDAIYLHHDSADHN